MLLYLCRIQSIACRSSSSSSSSSVVNKKKISSFVALLFYIIILTSSFAQQQVFALQSEGISISKMSSTKKSSSLWPSNNQPLLCGIITPLVTPLLVDDSNTNTIDVESTRKVIEHVIAGGVSGLFILGTTGEGPTLSNKCKQEFISTCCQIVNGRIPILVLMTCSSIQETIELGQFCQKIEGGVSAVVLTTPYYFPLDQPELLRYVDLVIEGMNKNNNNNNKDNNSSKPLPIMLYNIPVLTKVQWDIDTIRQIVTKYPTQIVGMKDSSGNLDYFQQLCELIRTELQRHDDFTILMGPEHLTLQSMKFGSNGGVNGGSNVEPQLFVQLYNEAVSAATIQAQLEAGDGGTSTEDHDPERVQQLQKRVLAFQDIYKVGSIPSKKHSFPFVAATKCAMKLRNLCSNDVLSDPMIPFNEEERQQVETILNNLPDI